MPKSISRLVAQLELFANKPWYFALIALVVGLDHFIAIVPVDGIVISSALLRPQQWISLVGWASLGSTLGGTLLGKTVQFYGEPFVHRYFDHALHTQAWLKSADFVSNHATISLLLMAMGPIPVAPLIAAEALAQVSLTKIFTALLAGRLVKYGVYAWFAAWAPRFLPRLTASEFWTRLRARIPKRKHQNSPNR